MFQHTAAWRRLRVCGSGNRSFWTCFNTQPPEGGWIAQNQNALGNQHGFNTQPPEGGWSGVGYAFTFTLVSTLSRLKAAGRAVIRFNVIIWVSTLSRLKAAGKHNNHWQHQKTFQHSAAWRRLDKIFIVLFTSDMFQHSAAWRRLDDFFRWNNSCALVSTLSRLKAAGSGI